MIICKIDNFKAKNLLSLSIHLKKLNLSLLEYYIKYEDFVIPTCPFCHKNCKQIRTRLKFCKTCGNKTCFTAFCKTRRFSDESKEKMRRARFNYMKNNFDNTAWGKRANGSMSYLENWFYENIIIKYNLLEKYDIINEYPVYPYFMDFAFTNIQLDVELDGNCHYINGKRQNHDLKRDNILHNKGWHVLRINSKALNEEKILNAIDDITKSKKPTRKMLGDSLFRGSLKKLKPKIDKRAINKQIYNTKCQHKAKILKTSNIDFATYGWVSKVAKLIDIKPQHVKTFMIRFLPEFYKENCFKRNVN